MTKAKEVQELLDKHVPVPKGIPRLYFLGDTGAGKTTFIRKILGTDVYKFPSIKQRRTTVATTEFVISYEHNSYKGVFILKPKDKIKELIKEIILEALFKINSKKVYDKEEISKRFLKQTQDARFRLYYMLDKKFSEELAERLIMIEKILEDKIHKEFDPSDIKNRADREAAIELILENSNEIAIVDDIYLKIIDQFKEVFGKSSIEDEILLIEEDNLDTFIKLCKTLLASERGSFSPLVEYARIKGPFKSFWVNKNIEMILVDGEGIGHSAEEVGTIDVRHFDQFYLASNIILVEESSKAFLSGGKPALKNIIERGFSDKLIIVFSKLDEVKVEDDLDDSLDEKKEIVMGDFYNVCHALKKEKVSVPDSLEDKIVYLHSIDKLKAPDSFNKEELNKFFKLILKEEPLSNKTERFTIDLTGFDDSISKAIKKFLEDFFNILDIEAWQTVKAFNRRMCWKNEDGFSRLQPISLFEEIFYHELNTFISKRLKIQFNYTSTYDLKNLNRLKRELNSTLIDLARKLIIYDNHDEWQYTLMELRGPGSTKKRLEKIKDMLENSLKEEKIIPLLKDMLLEIVKYANSPSN